MKKRLIDILKAFINKNFKNSKEVIIFFVFVFISSLFWLFASLAENYTTSLDKTIVFKNVPESKLLVSGNKEKLNIKVSGNRI